jgi:hypothetical protein
MNIQRKIAIEEILKVSRKAAIILRGKYPENGRPGADSPGFS